MAPIHLIEENIVAIIALNSIERFDKELESSANTKFECFLANNNGYTSFPCDVDGLIIHKNKALAILEFKNRNKSTSIGEEYLGKYG